MSASVRNTAKKLLLALRLAPEYLRISYLMMLDKQAGKKIVVFDIEELHFAPCVMPVVEQLRNCRTISLYFATLSVFKRNALLDNNYIPWTRRFDTTISHCLCWTDVFVSAHIHARGPRNAVRVNLFHNQPVKYPRFRKVDLVQYDVHMLLGPLCRRWMEGMFAHYALAVGTVQLLDIGCPKLDKLVAGAYHGSEVLKSLGLNPALKTVLYAPSWDKGLSLRTFGEKIVETLLSVPDINVMVKLHPANCVPPEHQNYDFYTGGVYWPNRFLKYAQSGRFCFITEIDTCRILASADVLITDVSSIALEYMIMNRPIIYFDCPEFFEKTVKEVYSGWGYDQYRGDPREDPLLNAGRHVGMVIEDLSELHAAVRRSLETPDEFASKRKDLMKELLYHPGEASRYAAEAIERLAQS